MSPADRARAASAERASVERAGMFYVCDSCGSIEVRDAVPEGGEWCCSNCQSSAAWEFPPERRAYAESHAARIRRGLASGLFVSVSR